MRELEKISEEIRKVFEENTKNITDEDGCHHFVVDCCTATYLVNKIIRKHTNDNPCGDCSRRKWCQEGYKDGKNDNNGWIPIEERLPEEPKENPEFEGKKVELYLVATNGTKYPFRAFWNGKQFADGWSILNVIAWHPLPKPYKQERSE